jgi:hypothetical protein
MIFNTVNPIKGSLNWQLVERKDIPSTAKISNTTFSNLTTGVEMYYIVGRLVCDAANPTQTYVRLNNDSGSNYHQDYIYLNSDGTHTSGVNTSNTYANISFYTGFNEIGNHAFQAYIWATPTDKEKLIQATSVTRGASSIQRREYGAVWTNSTDAITSIYFALSNGYGWIELYRKAL